MWHTGLVAPKQVGSSLRSGPGSNPCPLLWQADSYPLYHQGSPGVGIVMSVSQMTKLRLREGSDCPQTLSPGVFLQLHSPQVENLSTSCCRLGDIWWSWKAAGPPVPCHPPPSETYLGCEGEPRRLWVTSAGSESFLKPSPPLSNHCLSGYREP